MLLHVAKGSAGGAAAQDPVESGFPRPRGARGPAQALEFAPLALEECGRHRSGRMRAEQDAHDVRREDEDAEVEGEAPNPQCGSPDSWAAR